MIRAARGTDVKPVVELIHNAIGTIANTLAGTDDDAEMIKVLEMLFQQEGNRLSYENTIVKELDGQVVGFLLAYHGSQADQLDQPIIDRLIQVTGRRDITLSKEANEDEYYLDSIAVFDEYQGRGIAKELMRAFEQAGIDKGYTKLSLLVDKDNPGAGALYEKMRYKGADRVTIGDYDFLRMIKEIGKSSHE
jgi:ribosomal protein S18 acetylase RimI-like enzyme